MPSVRRLNEMTGAVFDDTYQRCAPLLPLKTPKEIPHEHVDYSPRILIRNGIILTMDKRLGDFAKGGLLIGRRAL
jgi:hypothetical protein